MNQTASPLYLPNYPRIISAMRVQNEFGYVFAPHKHEDHCEILLVKNGEANVQIGDKSYAISENDLLVYDQNIIHAEYSSPAEPFNCLVLAVTDIRMDRRKHNEIIGTLSSPVLSPEEHSFAIDNLFHSIFRYCDREDDYTNLTQQLLFSLLMIIDAAMNSPRKSKRATKVPTLTTNLKNYLDVNYSNQITLESLAKEFHFHPDYLCHVFTKEMGISPISYLVNRRIGESQFLLLSSEYSISDISHMVGYANINHFSAVFKRKLGMSPSRFRSTLKVTYFSGFDERIRGRPPG
jgi:AraC-like DNA-binding protein/quercetin dioxygenase-like cupin family protein